MSMRKVFVEEHIVASALEVQQLESQGNIKLYQPKNPRHRFYHDIKTAPYRTYQGPWGTEHLRWDGHSAGWVRVTEQRAQEIRHAISDCLFLDHTLKPE